MLNAWGEKDLFGQRIPKGFPLMLLVYPEDQDRLREAFNMVRTPGGRFCSSKSMIRLDEMKGKIKKYGSA